MSGELVAGIPGAVLSVEAMIQRRTDFKLYVDGCMVDGKDYGVIPGTDKPTLYKPGAEKVLSLYGLTTRMECIDKIEDWETGFFFYKHKCQVVWPRQGGDVIIYEGIGSANSKEKKYGGRWVTEDKLNPAQKALAEAGRLPFEGRDKETPLFVLEKEDRALWEKIKSENAEKPGTWKTYFKDSKKVDPSTKKPYQVEWVSLPAVKQYQVPNENIFDQVNTLEKMSQKRALVCAALGATNASDIFTQDVEDLPEEVRGGKADKPKTETKPSTSQQPTEEEANIADWTARLNECESIQELAKVGAEIGSSNIPGIAKTQLKVVYKKKETALRA